MAVGTILLFAAGSAAQDAKTGDILLPELGSGNVDAYIEFLKSDILAHMKKTIEVNMPLTEKEATLFWPIYGHYDYDLRKLNYERAQQYGFYAKNYKTLTDAQAKNILERIDSIERRQLTLDEKYKREMSKVLPMRTVLRFFVIARQFDRLVSLKIMSGMPLPPKTAP